MAVKLIGVPGRRTAVARRSVRRATLGEPAGAGRPEALQRGRLVAGAVPGRQLVAPAAVGALVDEGLGAPLPKSAAQGGCLLGVGLHPGEGAVLDRVRHLRGRQADPEKVRDLAYLAR